jgi:succinate dehydrogenase / fumarate reductase, cytochrome b subunit
MTGGDLRPLSPHLQIYRPQLTSVLSFTHRATGVVLGVCAIALVGWLVAAAMGPRPYASAQAFLRSWIGQALLVAGVFSFFLHLCGGLRHLFWDSGRGFQLRSIYLSGWLVVAASSVLTVAAFVAAAIVAR